MLLALLVRFRSKKRKFNRSCLAKCLSFTLIKTFLISLKITNCDTENYFQIISQQINWIWHLVFVPKSRLYLNSMLCLYQDTSIQQHKGNLDWWAPKGGYGRNISKSFYCAFYYSDSEHSGNTQRKIRTNKTIILLFQIKLKETRRPYCRTGIQLDPFYRRR